jgi:hypothetical protein
MPKKKEVMGPPPPPMAVLADEITTVIRKINRFLADYDKRYNYDGYDLECNAAITADSCQLKALRSEFRMATVLCGKLDNVARALSDHLSNFECRIGNAATVTEVTPSGLGLSIEEDNDHWHHGVRVGRHVTMKGVGMDGRTATVTRTTARGTKYRLSLGKPNQYGHYSSEVYGEDWRYEMAMAEARFWVVGGIKPLDFFDDDDD